MSISLFDPAAESAELLEPQVPVVTEPVATEVVVTEPATLPLPTAEELRQVALRSIEQANLPRGLRSLLAKSFEERVPVVIDRGRPLLPLDQALQVLESVVPSRWLSDPAQLVQLPHPLGDGFFDGNHDALTDDRASDIARRQLQRAGYLPSA